MGQTARSAPSPHGSQGGALEWRERGDFEVDLRAVRGLDGRLIPTLTLQPIGFLRTRQQVKFEAGHQPATATAEWNELELLAGHGYDAALQDLAGFERIWLLSWFHRNDTWRPLVLPPRGPAQRRGVFATRSPHRPNPIGLTAVPLLEIQGRRLLLGPCDLVDGTPILDVKPYVPTHDAFPHARAGWIDAMEAELSGPARFRVGFSEEARAQAKWLQETWQIDFLPRLQQLLSRDPAPHRTRRIRRRGTGAFEIGCGAWRAVFVVSGDDVCITALEAAYPRRFLDREDYKAIPDHQAQLEFLAQWPGGTTGLTVTPRPPESD